MSEDFKRKLEQYAEGTLTDAEHQEVEAELEKVELYQRYLNEIMGEEGDLNAPDLNEKKLVKRGKWKSRILNTLNTIGILFFLYFIAMVVTGFYYSSGDRNRFDRYREVINVSVATTIPNVAVGSTGMGGTRPFNMDFSGDLSRRVGSNDLFVGDLEGNFFFSNFSRTSELPRELRMNPPTIVLPTDSREEFEDEVHWWLQGQTFHQLDQLPDGTVAELFLSFSDFMTTDEVLQLFEGRNMELRWFAVDPGPEQELIWNSLGFPYEGYRLSEDWVIVSSEEGNNWSTEARMHEGFEPFGDADRREDEFLRALRLMNNYPSISSEFTYTMNLAEIIQYIEENGVRIGGVVVTGPTQELLTLQDEAWIYQAQVGAIDFWNWTTEWPVND